MVEGSGGKSAETNHEVEGDVKSQIFLTKDRIVLHSE